MNEKIPLDVLSPGLDLNQTLESLSEMEEKLLRVLEIAEETADTLAAPVAPITTDYTQLSAMATEFHSLVREVQQDMYTHIDVLVAPLDKVDDKEWQVIADMDSQRTIAGLDQQLKNMLSDIYQLEQS
jgi:hypothetical protein